MLQQTVIKAVIPVYDRFIQTFPTPKSLAMTDSETVRLAVRGLGYYRRFDHLHQATKHLVFDLKGKWPKSFSEWKKMPGVGDYTAAAISSITLNESVGVVDGNVERVMCRILNIQSAPNLPHLKKQFKVSMDNLARLGDPGSFNQAVMELGQVVCTPLSPKCPNCPIKKNCLSFAKGTQHLAPAAKTKINPVAVSLALLVPMNTKNVFLLKRSTSAKFLKGTLGFPTLIQDSRGDLKGDGFDAPAPLVEYVKKNQVDSRKIKHSITNHKITAAVIPVPPSKVQGTRVAVSIEGAESSLVSNLDRKALVAAIKYKLPAHALTSARTKILTPPALDQRP
jgi:A/G-specific adenine glycosylase